MGAIRDAFDLVYRDYATEGVAASGKHDPEKATIRALGVVIEQAVGTIATGGLVSVAYPTAVELQPGDLNHAGGSMGLIYADADEANIDLWLKAGAPGAGNWTNTGIIHLIAGAMTNAAVAAAEQARDDVLENAGVQAVMADLIGVNNIGTVALLGAALEAVADDLALGANSKIVQALGAADDAQAYAAAAGDVMQNAPKQAATIGSRVGTGQSTAIIGDVSAMTGNAQTLRAYGNRARATEAGPLGFVDVELAAAGDGHILIVADDGAGTGTVKATYPVTAGSTSERFLVGGDFSIEAWLDVGDTVFFQPTTAGAVRWKAGNSGRFFANGDYNGVIGDTVPLTDFNGTVAVAFGILTDRNNLGRRIEQRVPRRPDFARSPGCVEYDYRQWRDHAGTLAIEDLSGNAKHLYAVAGGANPRTDFTREGMRVRGQAWATAGNVSLRSHAVLLRIPEGGTGRILEMLTAPAVKTFLLANSQIDATTIYHYGLDGIYPMIANAAGNANSIINVGDGHILVFCESSALDVARLSIGGPATGTANRASDATLVSSYHSEEQWNDAGRLAIYDAARAVAAQNRGVYIDPRDCPMQADVVTAIGQSQPNGRARYTELSATYAAPGAQGDTMILIGEDVNELRADWQPLVMRENNKYDGLESTFQFGPEYAYARWHRSRRVRTAASRNAGGPGIGGSATGAYRTKRPLWILKITRGASYDIPAGNYQLANGTPSPVVAAQTYHPSTPRPTGLFSVVQDAIIVAKKMAHRRGVGLRLQLKHYSIGGQSGTLSDGAPLHGDALRAIDAAFNAVWGPPALDAKRVITKTGNSDAPYPANNDPAVTEIGTIRLQQVATVATWNGEIPNSSAIVSADAYTFRVGDATHFDGADTGMMAFGFDAMDAAAALGAFA